MGYKVTICLLLCLLFLGGCFKESVLSRALEDIKEPLTLMDERFSIYENALAVIGEYVKNPSDETLEAARTVNITAIAEIAELPAPVSSLTAEERAPLSNRDLTWLTTTCRSGISTTTNMKIYKL